MRKIIPRATLKQRGLLALSLSAVWLGACNREAAASLEAATSISVASDSLYEDLTDGVTVEQIHEHVQQLAPIHFTDYYASLRQAVGTDQTLVIDGYAFKNTASRLASLSTTVRAMQEKYGTIGNLLKKSSRPARKPTLAEFKAAIGYLREFYAGSGPFSDMDVSSRPSPPGAAPRPAGLALTNGVNCNAARSAEAVMTTIGNLANPSIVLKTIAEGGLTAQRRQEEINRQGVPAGSCQNEDYYRFHSSECGGGLGLALAENDETTPRILTKPPKPIRNGRLDPLGTIGFGGWTAGVVADFAGCPTDPGSSPAPAAPATPAPASPAPASPAPGSPAPASPSPPRAVNLPNDTQ